MRARDLLNHLRRQPFVPIRLYISDGAFYDVRHPEMMLVSASTVYIAQPPEEDGVPAHTVLCDPLHITRVEPINGELPELGE